MHPHRVSRQPSWRQLCQGITCCALLLTYCACLLYCHHSPSSRLAVHAPMRANLHLAQAHYQQLVPQASTNTVRQTTNEASSSSNMQALLLGLGAAIDDPAPPWLPEARTAGAHVYLASPAAPAPPTAVAKQHGDPGTTTGLGHQSVDNAVDKLTLPVWWFAPFLDLSSFGSEAATFMMALRHSDFVDPSKLWISLLQMQCTDKVSQALDPGLHQELMAMKARARWNTPAIVVCHNMPLFYGRPRARWASCSPCPSPVSRTAYTIARAMAETDRLHHTFVPSVNSLDEVWVPSLFSLEVLAASGVTRAKLRVVPPPVNTTLFDPAAHTPMAMPAGEQVSPPSAGPGPNLQPRHQQHEQQPVFTFVSAFKWEGRKGWDVLLSAYLSEFTSQDSVRLVLLTKPFLGTSSFRGDIQQWAKEHIHNKSEDQLPHLHVITHHLTNQQYAQLLAAAGAFVLPTRGEGWGLPLVEAMAMGLPVIATNYSGVTAYLDDSVGYPLLHTLVDVPENEPYWFRGSRWAQPDTEHLKRTMRQVMEDPQSAARKGAAARVRVLQRYAPHVIAKQLYQEFTRIETKLLSA